MIFSTTILWYLMFMMAAMVSNFGLINVGPSTTPRLLACIKLLSECADTLKHEKWLLDQNISYCQKKLKKKHDFLMIYYVPLYIENFKTTENLNNFLLVFYSKAAINVIKLKSMKLRQKTWHFFEKRRKRNC